MMPNVRETRAGVNHEIPGRGSLPPWFRAHPFQTQGGPSQPPRRPIQPQLGPRASQSTPRGLPERPSRPPERPSRPPLGPQSAPVDPQSTPRRSQIGKNRKNTTPVQRNRRPREACMVWMCPTGAPLGGTQQQSPGIAGIDGGPNICNPRGSLLYGAQHPFSWMCRPPWDP